MSWQPLSWADESGLLHRWLTVDSWDGEAQARAIHSWETAGDMAVMDAPMQLHVVEVGQMRNGRRRSPWCQAYKHPMYLMGNRYKFRRVRTDQPGYKKLNGDWEPVWLADMPKGDPEAWADLMIAEGLTNDLLHQPTIADLSPATRLSTLSQIQQLADRMKWRLDRPGGPVTAMEEPMARGACDGLVPCPYQPACYRERPSSDLSGLGLYVARAASSERSRLRVRDSQIASAEVSATS